MQIEFIWNSSIPAFNYDFTMAMKRPLKNKNNSPG
jgi:hypothetical protein